MNKLVVTSLESKFRVYDMRTRHPTEGYAHMSQVAHKSTVWAARHLPSNREVFMSTGGNGTLNLYQYTYPSQRAVADADGNERGVMGELKEIVSTPMSTQPIVAFDWHTDKAGLCCMAALDQTIKVAIVTKVAALQ